MRIYYNICMGEYFRFPYPPDEFRPCSRCTEWGWLDEVKRKSRRRKLQKLDEAEYGEDQ